MRIWLAPAAAAIFALSAAPAFADKDPNSGAPLPPSKHPVTPSPITDRFYVRGIYYAPHVKTDLQINQHNAAAGVVGTSLSGERDLGLQSRLNQGRFEMMFRLKNRNKVRVDFLDVDRTATHRLAQTIQFGNETFPVAALLSTHVDWRIFGITYTYSIFHNDRFELGTGLAVHLLQASKVRALMSGRAFVIPDDVKRVCRPVLRHRLTLQPDAYIEGFTSDDVLTTVLEKVEVPR